MPTYDYRCDNCDHQFEEFQSFSEPVLTKCPQCGKKKLRRLFGAGAGVIFKGSGFYETDYRSDSYTKAAKADQEKAAPKSDAGKADSNGTTGSPAEAGKTKSGGKSSKSTS
jgi:putative FmdB family regulatory protein